MPRVSVVAYAGLLVFAILAVRAALGKDTFSSLGPGAGFFTLVASGAMVVLSGVLLVRAIRSKPDPLPLLSSDARRRVLAVIVAQLAFAGVLGLVGFRVATFAYLAFLLLVVGDQSRRLSIFVAFTLSIGLYYAFRVGLAVPLPSASLPILKDFGL